MKLTPKELIKKLEITYANDMNQPITFFIHDTDDLFSVMFDKDRKFGGIYKTAKEIPNEIIDSCFENVFLDDRVHEAIKDSYEWDINKHIAEILDLRDETELWS